MISMAIPEAHSPFSISIEQVNKLNTEQVSAGKVPMTALVE